jgi:hypothetical protein
VKKYATNRQLRFDNGHKSSANPIRVPSSGNSSTARIDYDSDESAIFCERHLSLRFFWLGRTNDLKTRKEEFTGVKGAADIFQKTYKTIARLIEEDYVAAIRIRGTLHVHLPTTEALIIRDSHWQNSLNCPDCRKLQQKRP